MFDIEKLLTEFVELKAQVAVLQKRVDANPFVFTGLYADLTTDDTFYRAPIMIPAKMTRLIIKHDTCRNNGFNGLDLYVWGSEAINTLRGGIFTFTQEFCEMRFDFLELNDIPLSVANLPYHAKHLTVRFCQEFSIGLFRGLEKFVDTERLEILCCTKIAENVNNKLFGFFEIKPEGYVVISCDQANIYLDELFAIIKNTKIAKVTVFDNEYVVAESGLILA
jgi:hypothetical protein